MSAQVDVVSAALFDGDKVLLVQRKNPPYQHHWSLPGGRIMPGETADNAIQREIFEETELRVLHFHKVQKHKSAGYTLQVFAASAAIADAHAGDDAAAVRIVPIDNPPALLYTPDLWAIIRAAHQRLTEL